MNGIDPAVVRQLVQANHVLYARGVVDGFGHVSLRHPDNAAAFLLSRSRAPALVEPGDIGAYDLQARPIGEATGAPYLERFIHSEIYRARPDVMAIVHSHSPSVIPFGVTGQRLRPIFHMSGFLGSGSAHFEVREAGGETDMLVRNPALGEALARALGSHSCVLMRGHGSTVTGGTLEQAVYRAVYTEVNAKLQAAAMAIGEVNYLTPKEADLAAAANDAQIGRCWALWVQELATRTRHF